MNKTDTVFALADCHAWDEDKHLMTVHTSKYLIASSRKQPEQKVLGAGYM